MKLIFELNFIRGGSTWRPHVTATGSVPSPNQFGNISPVTRTSLAHKQPEQRPIGTGYNNAARPFNGVSDSSQISLKSVMFF